jgi:general secretion pathway protein N
VKLRRATARHAPRKAADAAQAAHWQRAQRAGRRFALWGGAAGLLAGLITQAPAQWLADALQQASAQRLLLAEARGSLWNGSAMLVLTGGAGSQDAVALPGRLHWQLRPDWRGLQLTAAQACCLNGDLRLHLQPAWGGYTLALGGPAPDGAAAGASPTTADPLGQWPAAWLAGLGTPWNTLQLGGTLQLSSPGLQLRSLQGRLQLDGALALELRQVSSRLSPMPVLGSYRLNLRGGQPAADPAGTTGIATLQLDTLDGALRLSGNGRWNGAHLQFSGEAQAAPGQDAALSNLLNIIGRRQGALSVISIG